MAETVYFARSRVQRARRKAERAWLQALDNETLIDGWQVISFDPPRPAGALEDVMDAFAGDGSAWSYLCASLLARELAEFGALWHGVSWADARILYGDAKVIADARAGWEWEKPAPEDWRPGVTIGDEQVVVRFFTFTGHETERIVETIDTYVPGRLRFASDYETVAVGGPGYIY